MNIKQIKGSSRHLTCYIQSLDRAGRCRTDVLQANECQTAEPNAALPVSHLCRHVTVKTTPNHKFVFTVKTHHTVAPGSIAFSLPQVCAQAREMEYSVLLFCFGSNRLCFLLFQRKWAGLSIGQEVEGRLLSALTSCGCTVQLIRMPDVKNDVPK